MSAAVTLDQTAWVAVDWGMTQLRAWALDADDRVLASWRADQDMSTLSRDDFGPVLERLLADLPPAPPGGWPVICCGMAGSREGWVEAPFRSTPCTPLDPGSVALVRSRQLSASILPGLSQANPPDVMRGAETRIAGLLARDPGFDGVAILPGTHNKWARISAGEVIGFRTFMTGELFDLLTRQSVLRHSTTATGMDLDAFDTGVAHGLRGDLQGALLSIRAGHLLNADPPEIARARLSGLLIGAELAAARGFWLGMELAIVGNTGLAELYARALAAQGAIARVHDAETLTLAGLAQIRAAQIAPPEQTIIQ